MKTQYYILFVNLALVSSASCSTKVGISDELYDNLRRTSHKPLYQGRMFDKENVWDTTVPLEQTSHQPDYTAKVVKIDHKRETLTLETGKKKTGKRRSSSSSK